MRVVYDDEVLRRYFEEAVAVSGKHPVLIDQFLEDAVEFDVPAVCDGRQVLDEVPVAEIVSAEGAGKTVGAYRYMGYLVHLSRETTADDYGH